MKKNIVIYILLIISICFNGYFIYQKYYDVEKVNNDRELISDNDDIIESNDEIKDDKESNCNIDIPIKEYTLTNKWGDNDKSITIKAIQIDSLSGFSGASSHVYYIDDSFKLHSLSLEDLDDKVIATGIIRFEVPRDDILTAYYNNQYEKLVDDQYVKYVENTFNQ